MRSGRVENGGNLAGLQSIDRQIVIVRDNTPNFFEQRLCFNSINSGDLSQGMKTAD